MSKLLSLIPKSDKVCFEIFSKNKPEKITFNELSKKIEDFKFNKNYNFVGVCDFVSLDIIIYFLACLENNIVPCFLSHPSEKQDKNLFDKKIKNITNIGIQTVYSKTFDFNIDGINENIEIPDDVFFVQLSSGTTNNQKGFAISKESLMNQINSYSNMINFNQDSIVVSWLPLYHDMGLITSLFMPLIKGARSVIIPTFEWLHDNSLYIDAINECSATHTWMPNFCFSLMANKINKEIYNKNCTFINCSEVCRENDVKQFMDKFSVSDVQTTYAMAENVFAVSHDKNINVENKILSSGIPIFGTEIEIIDEKINIKSNCLFDYHVNNGNFTKRKTNIYDTGDIGFFYDNNLFVKGRINDAIKVFGKQIVLSDVDNYINKNFQIKAGRVVCFGIQEQGTDKFCLMYESENDLSKEISNSIFENYEISCNVLRVPFETLIKTTSGKLSRSDNRIEFQKRIKFLNSCKKFFLENDMNIPKFQFDECLKSQGYVDSFSMMRFIRHLSDSFNLITDFTFDFSSLDTMESFYAMTKDGINL